MGATASGSVKLPLRGVRSVQMRAHSYVLWAAFAAAAVLAHGADTYDRIYDSVGHASVEEAAGIAAPSTNGDAEDVERMFREFVATQEDARPSLELIDTQARRIVPEARTSTQAAAGASTTVPHAVLVKLPPGMQLPPGAMRVVNRMQSHEAPQVQQLATAQPQ